jgi:shikimate 5-dehydrogenase
MYFIGVTTEHSSIMKVFPRWAEALQLGNAVIKGIDFRPHSDPELYREAVAFIKKDPFSPGSTCHNT